MMNVRERLGCLSFMIGAIGLGAGVAAGQSDLDDLGVMDERNTLPTLQHINGVQIDSRVLDLANELRSDSFARRQEAMNDLLAGEADLEQLLAVLSRHPLSPEQQHRIAGAVRDRIVNVPRGALGIQMDTKREPEVTITRLLPGLPAEHVLRINDRIFAVDGELLPEGHASLLPLVQFKKPGDRVVLSIRRLRLRDDGKPRRDVSGELVYDDMDVEIILGSAEKLDDFNPGRRDPILAQRRSFANTVISQFGPSPRVIRVPRSDVPPEARKYVVTAGTIAMHPAIRALQKHLDRIDIDPDVQVTDTLRDQWKTRLNQLLDEAAEPDLSDSERRYREAVAEAYRSLSESAR